AARNVIGAKARDDRVLDDELGDGVGERALEAVADLDAHLALAWRHDQQHAVVLVLLSNSPAAAELDAEILDRGPLQRSQRHDHELVGGLGFEVRELLRERRARWLIENIGLVHHATAERREDERKRRQRGEQEKRGEEQRQACAPATPIGLGLARRAHGATVRTSPAAVWSRLRRP